jgi:hypothetical protein
MNHKQHAAALQCIGNMEVAIPLLQAAAKSLAIKNYKLAQDALAAAYTVDVYIGSEEANAFAELVHPEIFDKFWDPSVFFSHAVSVVAAMAQLLLDNYGQ